MPRARYTLRITGHIPAELLRELGVLDVKLEPAATVLTTVISRSPRFVILDAGNKSVAAPDLTVIAEHDLENVRFDEEHGVFAAPADGAIAVGDVVRLLPGYAPSTVNMYDAYHVIENGEVVDIWPIVPRGPGHHGLVSP